MKKLFLLANQFQRKLAADPPESEPSPESLERWMVEYPMQGPEEEEYGPPTEREPGPPTMREEELAPPTERRPPTVDLSDPEKHILLQAFTALFDQIRAEYPVTHPAYKEFMRNVNSLLDKLQLPRSGPEEEMPETEPSPTLEEWREE